MSAQSLPVWPFLSVLTSSRLRVLRGPARLAGRVAISSTAVLAIVAPLAAGTALTRQQSPERVETLISQLWELEHQPAREALSLIEPLLSSRGSLELRVNTNTVVVRDYRSVVELLRPIVEEFDHRPIALELQIFLLRASRAGTNSGAADPEELPQPLLDGLGRLVQFNDYELLGQGSLAASEGDEVSYQLGGGFEVRFRIGTILGAERLRLREFEIVLRSGEVDRRLLYAEPNLNLSRMYVLSMSRTASSESGLVVALHCAPKVEVLESEFLDSGRLAPKTGGS